jgi:hypothetical protein
MRGVPRSEVTLFFPPALSLVGGCGGETGGILVWATLASGRASFDLQLTCLPLHPLGSWCAGQLLGFLHIGWQMGWRLLPSSVLAGSPVLVARKIIYFLVSWPPLGVVWTPPGFPPWPGLGTLEAQPCFDPSKLWSLSSIGQDRRLGYR